MIYEIIWSAFAERQIDEIHEFYLNKTKSLRIANRIIERILIAPENLKLNPEIGQLELDLKDRILEYRYIVESNYKLIYTINKDKFQIQISDVFDTRQNPVKIKRNK
ncbi:MAG: type II toxin-antitoxin system RelE/ParE family toxin [Weeksellaceae bacterium]